MSTARSLDIIETSNLAPEDKEKLRRLLSLLDKSALQMTDSELIAAREAAGLSRAQAARLIAPLVGMSIDSTWLRTIEHDWNPDAGSPNHRRFAKAFDEVYGLTPQQGMSL